MYGKEYHEWNEAQTIVRYIEMRIGGLVADVRREFLDVCDAEVKQLVEQEIRNRYPLPSPSQIFPEDDGLRRALFIQHMQNMRSAQQNTLPVQIVHGHGGILSGLFGLGGGVL